VLAAEIFKLLTDSGDPAAALFTLCALIMNVVLAIFLAFEKALPSNGAFMTDLAVFEVQVLNEVPVDKNSLLILFF